MTHPRPLFRRERYRFEAKSTAVTELNSTCNILTWSKKSMRLRPIYTVRFAKEIFASNGIARPGDVVALAQCEHLH